MYVSPELIKHIEKHVLFPATGKDIIESFNQPSDSKDDMDEIGRKIDPENIYHSLEDVKTDLELF
ncbi:MAG: hypothetical protein WC858_05790 [Parcubacteria group bacterium]|jgi:hypothetical protein